MSEKVDALQLEKEKLQAENAELEKQIAETRTLLMERDVNAKDYSADLKTFLKNLDDSELENAKEIILDNYEFDESSQFSDDSFLEVFTEKILSIEEITKSLTHVDSEALAIFKDLQQVEKRIADYEEVIYVRGLFKKGIACLCGEEGKNILFVTNEIKEVVKSLNFDIIEAKIEENEEIFQYILSAVNLYGAIHYKDLRDVYTHYNPDKKMKVEQFRELAENFSTPINYLSFIVDDVVSVEFFNYDEERLVKLLMLQEEKPRYIPTKKEEFLNYADDHYIRPTLESKAMFAFFKEIDDDPVHLENLMGMIQFDQINSATVEDSLRSILYGNYLPPSQNQQSDMLDLLVAMDFNARKWEHNGYSAFDLHTKYPNQFSLNKENKPQKFTQTEGQSKNGPCPCGSGKKYKRCCGK